MPGIKYSGYCLLHSPALATDRLPFPSSSSSSLVCVSLSFEGKGEMQLGEKKQRRNWKSDCTRGKAFKQAVEEKPQKGRENVGNSSCLVAFFLLLIAEDILFSARDKNEPILVNHINFLS